jgi:hypothetical protein
MRGPPATTIWPFTLACAPGPARASKFAAYNWARLYVWFPPRWPWPADVPSWPRQQRLRQGAPLPACRGATAIPDTTREPRVSVPALSNITMSRSRARSRASRSLIRRPFCGPRDVETAITVEWQAPGCGQAMISTVAVRSNACSLSPDSHQ